MGLGKSFKKAFKKVTKVATLGIGVDKVAGALSGGLVGDSSVYGDSGGLGMLTGNNQMAENAAKDQARMAQQQRDQEAILMANQNALQSNGMNENIASVVSGGSAASSDTNALLKKRRQGGSLSSTLGIS